MKKHLTKFLAMLLALVSAFVLTSCNGELDGTLDQIANEISNELSEYVSDEFDFDGDEADKTFPKTILLPKKLPPTKSLPSTKTAPIPPRRTSPFTFTPTASFPPTSSPKMKQRRWAGRAALLRNTPPECASAATASATTRVSFPKPTAVLIPSATLTLWEQASAEQNASFSPTTA